MMFGSLKTTPTDEKEQVSDCRNKHYSTKFLMLFLTHLATLKFVVELLQFEDFFFF